ncbi:nucleoredoxin-like protein 1 [Cinclus cinclus]|nr:NXNL1 protein [Cinclus mexicanus]
MAWALFSGRSLRTANPERILDTDRELRAALDNRILLLLFRQPRCPRCREFEPHLRRFWGRLTDPARVERAQQVGLVYVGHDRCEQEHLEYLRDMARAWVALPYGDGFGRELQQRFGVSELPSVVVLAPSGSVLVPNAVREIRDLGISCFQNWKEAAELVDRNFQEREEFQGWPRRSLTDPLRRLKYRLWDREEEEGEKEEEERRE